MKVKYIDPIEYATHWELTIGRVAPWNRLIQFRVSKRIARWFL